MNSEGISDKNRLYTSRSRKSKGISSVTRSQRKSFTFHPEINRDNKWIPKYDDHHDHEEMVERMHRESKLIERKRRIMSAEKQREELSYCSFNPKINDHNKNIKTTKFTTEESANFGEKMYEYANRFKNKLDIKKEMLEEERGQQINFRPKIVTTKTLLINREKGEVYEDLYEDHSVRKTKLQEKIQNKKVKFLIINLYLDCK